MKKRNFLYATFLLSIGLFGIKLQSAEITLTFDIEDDIFDVITMPETHEQLSDYQKQRGMQPIDWDSKKLLIKEIIEKQGITKLGPNTEPLYTTIRYLDVPFAIYLKSKGAQLGLGNFPNIHGGVWQTLEQKYKNNELNPQKIQDYKQLKKLFNIP